MFLLKCLAAGAIAVVAGEIITRRALKKAEERAKAVAEEIIEEALNKAEQRASTFVDSAVDLAVDRLEANTGLPLYYGHRHPWLNALLNAGRREEAPNERHQSGSPQMA